MVRERFGVLDRRRGIVNVGVKREGRRSHLSMDEALVGLALDLFDGDGEALGRWLQGRVDEWEARRLGGSGVPYSSLSRLIQREVIELARRRLAGVGDRGVVG